MILLTLGWYRFYHFRVPTPTNGSRGWLDDLWINVSAAEDGRFPCRVSKTAVSSERREWDTSAGSGGCLSRQSRTAASPRKGARWCCLAQAQFKVEAEAAAWRWTLRQRCSLVCSLREEQTQRQSNS